MHIVDEIVDAFGGTNATARALRTPVQTVSSWRTKGRIPPWRRLMILSAASGVALSPTAIAYLIEDTQAGGGRASAERARATA